MNNNIKQEIILHFLILDSRLGQYINRNDKKSIKIIIIKINVK